MKGIFKNWMTTLAGQAAGLGALFAAGIHNPDGSINVLAFVLYGAFSLVGGLAKDHNVTGGTK